MVTQGFPLSHTLFGTILTSLRGTFMTIVLWGRLPSSSGFDLCSSFCRRCSFDLLSRGFTKTFGLSWVLSWVADLTVNFVKGQGDGFQCIWDFSPSFLSLRHTPRSHGLWPHLYNETHLLAAEKPRVQFVGSPWVALFSVLLLGYSIKDDN